MKIPKILNLLEEVIKEEEAKRVERGKNYPYRHNPSSASLVKSDGKIAGPCLRQLYYKATKAEATKDINIKGYLTMQFGNGIHNVILKLMQKIKSLMTMVEVGSRVVIDPLTREVSFRLDGLTTEKDSGTVGGIEIKTCQGHALTKKVWGMKHTGPKEDHLLQIICYMNVNPSIKWFSLIYLARDNGYRLEYHITRDGDTYFLDGKKIKELNFEKIKERWKTLEGHIERKEVPAREFKVFLNSDMEIQKTKTKNGETYKSDWRCLYCPYAETVCWKGDDTWDDSYNKKYGI